MLGRVLGRCDVFFNWRNFKETKIFLKKESVQTFRVLLLERGVGKKIGLGDG